MHDEDAIQTKEDREEKPDAAGVSRRGFLKGLGGSLAATALGAGVVEGEEASANTASAPDVLTGMATVNLTVNGQKRTAKVDVRRTLLEMLRSDLNLTGAKQVCNHGSCGACTVSLNGETVYSCMTLAVDAEGTSVETVEGLAKNGVYTPLQTAFVEKDALMCGFCTPGFLMSCSKLLEKNPNPTLADVKDACAGNICRCGTYPRIFEAVLATAKKGAK